MTDVKPAAVQNAAAAPLLNVYARVALVFLGLLLLASTALYYIYQANRESFMKYGLGQVIDRLERGVARENGLTTEQSQECLDYLDKLKAFVLAGPITKDKLLRYHAVATPFKRALQDRWIQPEELMTIRQAIWKTDLESPAKPDAPAAAVSETGKK